MRIKDKKAPNTYHQLFEDLKRGVSIFDPVAFAENYLKLDSGEPFDLSSSGWKYMADLWRFVALQADNKKSKPIVELKGRQVGATTKAGAMGLYFTASGMYGTEVGRPPIRVMHLFPSLKHVGQYTKEKLGPMIRNSQDNFISRRSLQYDPNAFGKLPDDTLSEKFFIGENILRIDSVGKDADRIRGSTQDVLLFDECFPYNQCIEVEGGKKVKIGKLYDIWKKGGKLPKVLTYNEQHDTFEYKKITYAWKRKKRKLIEIVCSKRKISCTPNHRFLTERGWVQAGSLLEGDLLKVSPGTQQYIHPFGENKYQVILGSFLGDGHLSSHTKGRYRLSVRHGIKQREYCAWKSNIFNSKLSYLKKNGYAQTPAVNFISKSFALPSLPQTKTTCPQWVLDSLDARGLAIWFMDDGDVRPDKLGGKISTCSFDEDSQKRIVKRLKEFGIESHYSKYKGYFYIMLNKKGYRSLSKIIEPYVHPSLSYKVYDQSKVGSYDWNIEKFNYGFYRVDKINDKNEAKVVYDIEVEDNHNFIATSSFKAKGLGGPIVHNCQDIPRKAIDNASKIAQHAKYGARAEGLRLFFGTPKNSGTYFWQIWNASDQRFYQLKCGSCEEHFFLYTLEDDSWNDVWIKEQEVRCPHCAFHQSKLEAIDNGRWVPTRVTKDGKRVVDFHQNKPYVGFHHNLMLMPIFEKEDVLKSWPKHNPNATERAWKNETIGDFYSGGGLPLTIEDIIENALDETRGTAKMVKDRTGKTLVLGMDWGGIDDDEEEEGITRGQSYTTAVILSIDTAGVFTIENAFKLKKNDLMYHVDVIDKLFKTYQIHQAVADLGYGQQTVRYMQLEMNYKHRFLGCYNSGNINKQFSYDPKYMRVTVNKDQMIEEIFEMIRRGRIKFPAKGLAWEKLHWLAEHCTSMETVTRMKNENVVKKYVKGSKPNDGLMALMYAVIAYKYLSTGAFKSVKETHSETQFPAPILSYTPRMR